MNGTHHRLALTLGPILFNWPEERWRDFYARIADEAPVDRVCIGEVICSKRQPYRDYAIGGAIERLERAGKEVVLSTLALPTTAREVRTIGDTIDSGYLVEANDIATIHLLAGRPHVIGPFLNVYNEAALVRHVALGATCVCLPPELPLDAIRVLAATSGAVEVFAFGRAPLALSARCYHARVHNLTKDSCQFVCERDVDGLDVATMDGKPFLVVNGIETLGHAVTSATRQVGDLSAAGVAALRLSPHTCDMVQVSRIFRDLADERIDAEEASESLVACNLPGPLCDGYLRGQPGWWQAKETD